MESIILGIETSCDDTCVAILRGDVCVSHIFASQDHNKYGGILPEYAARNHITTLPPLVRLACEEAHIEPTNLDLIAATYAPGLLGSLMVGLSYAKGLSWALGKPFLGVHHVEAHILVAQYQSQLRFPYGAIVISGGHTLLVLAKALGEYEVLGHSLDDACGECFDKVARELGLLQPGGPQIEKLARDGAYTVPLPIPLHRDGSCNFSFSGLKTATIKAIPHHKPADIAHSLQHTVALHLAERLQNMIKLHPDVSQWALVGGVAANQYIRQFLEAILAPRSLYCPPMKLCTDNGLMIAYTAKLYQEMGRTSNLDLGPRSTMHLSELTIP